MEKKQKTIRDLKWELDRLYRVDNDPRVKAAQELVLKERQPKIEALKTQIEELQTKRPAKKPRWPDNTPAEVIELCKRYWSGTEEFASFRIHCWNDKGICTGYPSGGYSNNGGWNPTPARFYFISRTKNENELGRSKPYTYPEDLEGRQSQKQLEAALERIVK